MSLKKLFKRKPGGTMVGNLLRAGVRTATGGILGNGALMISKEEYEAKNRGEKTSNEREKNYLLETAGAGLAGIDNKEKTNTMIDKIKQGGAKSMMYVAGVVVGIIGLVFIAKKIFSKKSPAKR